jgi:cytochrome P450
LNAIPRLIIYPSIILFEPPFTTIRTALNLKSLIKRVVNKRKEDETNHKLNYKESTDSLTNMIHATDEGNIKFTHDELISNCNMLFTAGYESTSTTMQWALFFLIKYPEVQRKLREEANEIFEKYGQNIEYNTYLDNFKYTKNFISEILRHKRTWTGRSVLKDYTYNGVKYKKGISCF